MKQHAFFFIYKIETTTRNLLNVSITREHREEDLRDVLLKLMMESEEINCLGVSGTKYSQWIVKKVLQNSLWKSGLILGQRHSWKLIFKFRNVFIIDQIPRNCQKMLNKLWRKPWLMSDLTLYFCYYAILHIFNKHSTNIFRKFSTW